MAQDTFGIGELARRTSVNIETIRYYERIGIMPPPPRSSGGHRVYDDDLVGRLSFIARGRSLGFSLDDVRRLLEMADGPAQSCGEVRDMALRHVRAIRGKVIDLQRLESVLRDLAEQCDGGEAPECPIIEALACGKAIK